MTTSPNPYRDRALDHLAAAQAARDHLADLYSTGRQVDRARVAELHEAVRLGAKFAQVNALLSIEGRLASMVSGDVLADLGLERVTTARAAS